MHILAFVCIPIFVQIINGCRLCSGFVKLLNLGWIYRWVGVGEGVSVAVGAGVSVGVSAVFTVVLLCGVVLCAALTIMPPKMITAAMIPRMSQGFAFFPGGLGGSGRGIIGGCCQGGGG